MPGWFGRILFVGKKETSGRGLQSENNEQGKDSTWIVDAVVTVPGAVMPAVVVDVLVGVGHTGSHTAPCTTQLHCVCGRGVELHCHCEFVG